MRQDLGVCSGLRHPEQSDELASAGVETPRKILIVDDDPSLLRTIEVFLTRRGFQVLACEKAREALEKFSIEPEAYWVLVVDMTLQDMPAAELVERVLRLDHRVGVVVTSGYPVRLPISATETDARIVALQKPFTPVTFVQTIERLISSRH